MSVVAVPGQRAPATATAQPWVVALDLTAKLALVILLGLVLVDPQWGNLEGKAPMTRALTYPLWSLLVPVVWAVRMSRGVVSPYPWLGDLLVTLTSFSDVLGNRLDLYDTIVWFDDWMHFVVNAMLGAAMIIVTMPLTASFFAMLQRSIAFVMTASLAWELFEYVSFVTRSAEHATAYSDTLSDLALGWLGAACGALLCHEHWKGAAPSSHLDAARATGLAPRNAGIREQDGAAGLPQDGPGHRTEV